MADKLIEATRGGSPAAVRAAIKASPAGARQPKSIRATMAAAH